MDWTEEAKQMKALGWSDSTSYKRGERGTVRPRHWVKQTAVLHMAIHRHICYPGTWLLSCHAAHIENRILSTCESGGPLDHVDTVRRLLVSHFDQCAKEAREV